MEKELQSSRRFWLLMSKHPQMVVVEHAAVCQLTSPEALSPIAEYSAGKGPSLEKKEKHFCSLSQINTSQTGGGGRKLDFYSLRGLFAFFERSITHQDASFHVACTQCDGPAVENRLSPFFLQKKCKTQCATNDSGFFFCYSCFLSCWGTSYAVQLIKHYTEKSLSKPFITMTNDG